MTTAADRRSEAAARSMEPRRDVVLSNGFSRFQLIVAASELERRGRLTALITASYPTAAVRDTVDWLRLGRVEQVARLIDRRDDILDERVRSLWGAELTSRLLGPFRDADRYARSRIGVAAMRAYGRSAARIVRDLPQSARLYHYRSGFGHRSVEEARRRGLALLCDHSIAHPALVDHLVESGGAFPASGEPAVSDRLWSSVLGDIERADFVLVNSDFVKQTFIFCGWDPAKVHVLYWGIDDWFLNVLPPRRFELHRPLRLLFAGSFNQRKGAGELVSALTSIADKEWQLDIAGPVSADLVKRHASFLTRRNVRIHGVIRRSELAQLMSLSDVFVFPSRAEGSARVVFEALASGCFVLTTPNAGSIVKDGVHGRIVPPADPSALAAVLAALLDDPAEIPEVGKRNRSLICSSHRQQQYGDGLERVYDAVLGDAP